MDATKHFAGRIPSARKSLICVMPWVQLPVSAQVLCASNEAHDKVEPVLVPEGVPVGERVRFEGFDGPPEAVLNPKKKLWEKIAPDLKTDAGVSVQAAPAIYSRPLYSPRCSYTSGCACCLLCKSGTEGHACGLQACQSLLKTCVCAASARSSDWTCDLTTEVRLVSVQREWLCTRARMGTSPS